ncbi:class I SAM-dependent methyltransferase [Hymenobacter jejuensis]|uniref:Class I SAM-dependent methyltransferase n=1 Tax=Hymenobacter jejuensis TaxID=2502781 RepID=A0A5B7ZXR4_9BACT|nr:class I SAM-dependent methyltransferase [Hymenobacter jejuensis]QDA59355.1 class I SAM-dependent methyltransferase [Hymenobacter jejuensis]
MESLQDVIEENFCLKFELKTLAEVILRNESERWVPGFLHSSTEYSHIERYKLSCIYSKGKKVIDIACGVGKGSYVLAKEGGAYSVKGYDIQHDAIRYARWRNKLENVKFDFGDAEKLQAFEEFDLAVSFETVEHLKDYKAFVKNIHNSLRSDGLFLVSTPISSVAVNKNPINPYHVQEWGFKEFQKIISEYFIIEKIYVQLYPLPLNSSSSIELQEVAAVNHSLSSRILRKLKIMLSNKPVSLDVINKNTGMITEETNMNESLLPEIEEFVGQYDENELGVIRTGYQILVGRKKQL